MMSKDLHHEEYLQIVSMCEAVIMLDTIIQINEMCRSE